MSGFLDGMAESSRERLQAARARQPLAALRSRCRDLPPALPPRRTGSFDLIAELKLRSPALGQLATADDDFTARVAGYARAGAAAVSVLTEPTRFAGSLAHLEAAAATLASSGVPAMRKDFLVDSYQLYEARAHGAGGALLIVRMLSPAALIEMIDCAVELGLFVLIEAFDEQDISGARAAIAAARETPAGQLLLGVNSRDLQTLEVVPQRLEALAARLPREFPRVAESGLVVAEDAARVARAGYDMALVGGALMQAADPPALLEAMLAAGRSVA